LQKKDILFFTMNLEQLHEENKKDRKVWLGRCAPLRLFPSREDSFLRGDSKENVCTNFLVSILKTFLWIVVL
jgi:hypothetical protein